MDASDADQFDEWVDDEAGPLVRPFTVTRGRTQPVAAQFDLVTIVVATQPEAPPGAQLMPEHRGILRLCQRPLSVAEVSAHLKLPLGAVRVLLDDLLQQGLIRSLMTPPTADHAHDPELLESLLVRLHSL